VAELNIVTVGDTVIELRLPAEIGPAAIRALCGTTNHDADIDLLEIPENPTWRRRMVELIRWYRLRIGGYLGSRCVFEPSCSHYAEVVFRQYGFLRACLLTAQRLARCRPGHGGLDLPPVQEKGDHSCVT